MPLFIVDSNVDLDVDQKRHMAVFFRDMLKLNGYRIVVGGTKMKSEMEKKEKLLKLVGSYSAINRVVRISDQTVDDKENEISNATVLKLGSIPRECDDFHIFALALLADCQNIITNDQRMSICIGKIRATIGHSLCPNLRNIQSEDVYLKLKAKGQL